MKPHDKYGISKFQKRYKLNNCQLADLINSFTPKKKADDYRPIRETSIRDWKTEKIKCPSWLPGFLLMLEETERVSK